MHQFDRQHRWERRETKDAHIPFGSARVNLEFCSEGKEINFLFFRSPTTMATEHPKKGN